LTNQRNNAPVPARFKVHQRLFNGVPKGKVLPPKKSIAKPVLIGAGAVIGLVLVVSLIPAIQGPPQSPEDAFSEAEILAISEESCVAARRAIQPMEYEVFLERMAELEAIETQKQAEAFVRTQPYWFISDNEETYIDQLSDEVSAILGLELGEKGIDPETVALDQWVATFETKILNTCAIGDEQSENRKELRRLDLEVQRVQNLAGE
jgi:hypothetical protein